MIIVVVDIFVILALIIFTWALEIGQENYVKMFLDHTIEMTDFTIRIKHLPEESQYCDCDSPEHRDDILKALLTNHFQSLLKDYLHEQDLAVLHEFDESSRYHTKVTKPYLWDIADICFGKGQLKEISYLKDLNKLRKESTKLNIKIAKS